MKSQRSNLHERIGLPFCSMVNARCRASTPCTERKVRSRKVMPRLLELLELRTREGELDRLEGRELDFDGLERELLDPERTLS